MTKADKLKKLSVPIYVLLTILCVLLLRRSGGFWRTLPFLLILPPLAVSFRNQKAVTVLILTVSGFVCARLDDYTTMQAALFAVGVGIIAAIGILIKRFIVTARVGDERKKISIIGAAVFALIGILFGAFCFGTPIAYFSADKTAKRYCSETYGDGAPAVIGTAYNPFERRFESTLVFTDGNAEKTALFYRDDNGVFDGCRAYRETRLLSQKRDEYTMLLSEKYPDYVFEVKGVSIDTDAVLDENSNADSLEGDMTFTISFYTLFPDEQTYERVCGDMRETLKDRGTFLFEQNIPQE